MPAGPEGSSPTSLRSRALAARVGTRIRRLRGARDVSLTRLANDSGLAKGTLSELENGYRNPTLDTLFAITTALGVPLSSLLADSPDAGDDVDEVAGASVHATLLHRHRGGSRDVEVYVVTVSGARQESSAHQAGVTETLVVVDGTFVAGNAGDLRELGAGDSLTYRGDRAHAFQALDGGAVAVLVMSYPLDRDGDRGRLRT